MKYYESHFDEYIKSNIKQPLHTNSYNITDIDQLSNLIIYGAPGIGKYTQTLLIIKNLSPSQLKYEKKMVLSYNKLIYYFKISDIHYEVDMSLLGCNAKLLWHEIYNQIIDIISSKNNKFGIIVCKYFQEIHTELLEIFYSYMQSQYNSCINIKFILITQDLSFIPDNILNCCKHIKFSRPSRSLYNKCLKIKLDTSNNISLLTNIKDIKGEKQLYIPQSKKAKCNIIELHKNICDLIIDKIININEIKYLNLRDILYDICIFDLNIANCLWYILYTLINKKLLDKEKLNSVLVEMYNFFKLYNNNYRPIYHLEKYILYIVAVVHELL
jgi:hypothetical protein